MVSRAQHRQFDRRSQCRSGLELRGEGGFFLKPRFPGQRIIRNVLRIGVSLAHVVSNMTGTVSSAACAASGGNGRRSHCQGGRMMIGFVQPSSEALRTSFTCSRGW